MKEIIKRIANKVQSHLSNAEGGHDWWHIDRVWKNAILIARQENVDPDIVSLAALLHDIADPKFHDGDESIGPRLTKEWLVDAGVDQDSIEHIVNIVKHMSYKNSLSGQTWSSPELLVVQDADRLDAIGAIGIARAFSYGGYKQRAMYDPLIAPMKIMTKEQYKASKAPTINHFYEKLLKLKKLMNTKAGKEIAQERHDFMVAYLNQFYKECGAIPAWHEV